MADPLGKWQLWIWHWQTPSGAMLTTSFDYFDNDIMLSAQGFNRDESTVHTRGDRSIQPKVQLRAF
ncbi:hypothetical protein GBA52_021050 [Prunus armeniaca]|nr:hypothetical protein GBA52_021050 [Prunus armeniaca]